MFYFSKNIIIPITVIFSLLFARLPQNRATDLPPDFFRSQSTVEHTVWDGNQISTWHGNHGDVVSYHVTGNSGLECPKLNSTLQPTRSSVASPTSSSCHMDTKTLSSSS